MTITSLEPQKNRKDRVSIFVDGEFAFGLSLDALALLGLKKGDLVTAEQLAEWRETAIYDEAKTAAFTMLARRIHSEKEVRDKLRKKKFPAEIIEKVIARLYEMNLLNDSQFASALVRDRLKRTPIGKSALKSKLFQKGIAKEMIDEVLSETDLNSEELCTKAAERKLKTLAKEPDAQKRKQKLVQFLMRRGFEWETIRTTLRTLNL
ncbi:MAG: regulatory protein RecX [Chloroherpetonaceae bacterium]